MKKSQNKQFEETRHPSQGQPLDQHRRLYFSVFILLCFLLAVLSSQNGTVRWLDAQMFHFASYLLPAQSESNDFRVIQLDEARLQKPEGVREFRFFLRKLRKAKVAEVVWLSDDFPQMDYVPVDDDKEGDKAASSKKVRTKTKAKTKKSVAGAANGADEEEGIKWRPTQGERNKLAWMLENQHVFLTQYTNVPQQQNHIAYGESLLYQDGWRRYIPAVFLPEIKTFRVTNTQLPYRVYPFDPQLSDEQALIWYDEGRAFSLPGLTLAVFSRYQNSSKLHWSETGEISLDGMSVPAGLSGKVFNYFSALTGRHTVIDIQSLQQAADRPRDYFKNRIVLIGQDVNRLQILADSLSSLQMGVSYYTPAESWWMLPAMLALVVIYLLWLLPLLSKQSGLFLGAFLVMGIISAQPVLLILKGIWWPTINILLLMLIGQLAVYVYISGKVILDCLVKKQHDAWFQLGHYQYEKGDYETALTSLLKCGAEEEVLADLYEIGLSFERKRQYDRGLQVYSEISSRQKNYKDIEKRIRSIIGFSSTKTKVLSPNQQKTLVMSQMEMPELGRYKIEKELGRGAMGVVYLGLDPKINRKVAIKTLDYSQFSDKELKSLKPRFFREAEAAGRLSHNNIVTVYDMGEEPDFAFIAMDFVEGVPLSDYATADNLLPVSEVYRIIQIVAEALDYAHKKSIVHRDIKPGNIMYNPKDRQVKITDFGIARITDSVKTRTGSFLGSPSYMAPEQMTGAHVDGRADIYSLGITFYQLLTGRLPFKADSLANLAYKITNENFKPVREARPDLPSSATRIINKALQKKPEKRYATGIEMVKVLQRETF
ncbi:MAG: serine/threonine protein kinase [Proteobacteria bacterium]|nr:serine/threonine protein kinase [Pseudomonadota bacterium]